MMDEDIIRKHCKLLMFDINKDSNGRGPPTVDYTSSADFIQSKDFIFTVEPIKIDHPSSFKIDHEPSLSTELNSPSPNSAGPPRPPNAFILYRKAKQQVITAERGNISNRMISTILAERWKNETEEVKFQWRREADRRKMEHARMYPGYVYRPCKRKGKAKLSPPEKRSPDNETHLAATESLPDPVSAPPYVSVIEIGGTTDEFYRFLEDVYLPTLPTI